MSSPPVEQKRSLATEGVALEKHFWIVGRKYRRSRDHPWHAKKNWGENKIGKTLEGSEVRVYEPKNKGGHRVLLYK